MSATFTIGVEEEYQIVEDATGRLCRRAERVLPEAEQRLGDAVRPELFSVQLETATPVCESLTMARAEIVRLRRGVIEAAAGEGRVISAGTHPFSEWQELEVTPRERYRGIAEYFQQLARELVICGIHVHVGVEDREAALGVMNRARLWLAPILALSASSPFWLGHDTGYASYRTHIWGRFPTSGPPLVFDSLAEHDGLVRALVDTGSIGDATNIYWDLRLPTKTPTVEFRVADACMTVDEAVMVAGLCRGLARVCYEDAVAGRPFPATRPELLRAAHWRASRFGLDGELLDLMEERAVSARQHVERLLDHVRPALEDWGEWDEVSDVVLRTLADGNGAARQRAVYERTGRLEAVVSFIVHETMRGVFDRRDFDTETQKYTESACVER